jgi:hypothetical protein
MEEEFQEIAIFNPSEANLSNKATKVFDWFDNWGKPQYFGARFNPRIRVERPWS